MEYRLRVNLFSTAVVIAIGVAVSMITSVVVASRTYRHHVTEKYRYTQDLTVKGYARVPVRSDLGTWHIQVGSEGQELAEAYTVLAAHVQRVRSFLINVGFAEPDVSLHAIETSRIYKRDEKGHTTPDLDRYRLSRRFTVQSADVGRIATAAGEVTSLLKEGVPVVSQSPAFTYTKVGDLKIRVLGEASADARTRAEELASKAGCGVGAVKDLRMGVMQITTPHSTQVSSMGIYSTATIDKAVSVAVTVTFGIEDA